MLSCGSGFSFMLPDITSMVGSCSIKGHKKTLLCIKTLKKDLILRYDHILHIQCMLATCTKMDFYGGKDSLVNFVRASSIGIVMVPTKT